MAAEITLGALPSFPLRESSALSQTCRALAFSRVIPYAFTTHTPARATMTQSPVARALAFVELKVRAFDWRAITLYENGVLGLNPFYAPTAASPVLTFYPVLPRA